MYTRRYDQLLSKSPHQTLAEEVCNQPIIMFIRQDPIALHNLSIYCN